MDAWQRLDTASDDDARAFLFSCCGSTRWVERMLERRPFGSQEQLLTVARAAWFDLSPADWREAFAHHPRIGDRASLRARFPATAHLSEREQQGVEAASDATLDALAAANEHYETKFGFIFIVCASGKTADEMLTLLRQRLNNDAQSELLNAAAEQAKITALRLTRTG